MNMNVISWIVEGFLNFLLPLSVLHIICKAMKQCFYRSLLLSGCREIELLHCLKFISRPLSQLLAAHLHLCVVCVLQSGNISMLFWARVEHYSNKQVKTFGSQMAESAVCVQIQPPL